MKQNYQVIWKIFTDDISDEEMKDAIYQTFEGIRDKLKQMYDAQSMVLFHQSLKVLKFFKSLENYISDSDNGIGKQFSNEYNEWLSLLNLNSNVVYETAKSYIEEQNYQRINLALQEQQALNELESQQTIVKIQGKLKKKCLERLKEIYNFINNDEYIDYHLVKSLNKRAIELIMIRDQIEKHHISEEFLMINECVERFFKKLIYNNREIIQNIKKQILMKRYSQAYSQLKSTYKITGQLNLDINKDEIGSQLEALNELKNQVLKKLIEHSEEYKSIEISRYQSERPKELIENLSMTTDIEFQTHTLAIEIAIEEKYNLEIDKILTTIKNGDSTQETKNRIENLQKSLKYLTTKLQSSIKHNIDQVTLELEKDIENYQNKILYLQQNETDLGKLSYALSVKTYDLNELTKQKINATFQDQCFIAQKQIEDADIKKIMVGNLQNIWLMQQDPVMQQITKDSISQYQQLIRSLRISFDSVIRSIIIRLIDKSISNTNHQAFQQYGINPIIQNKDDAQIGQLLAEYFNLRRTHPQIKKDIINDFEMKVTQLALMSTSIFKQQEERFQQSVRSEKINGACKTIAYQRRIQQLILNFKKKEFLDEIKTVISKEAMKEFINQISKNSYENNCKIVGAIIQKGQFQIMKEKDYINARTRYIDLGRKSFYSEQRFNLNNIQEAAQIYEYLKANTDINIVEVLKQCIAYTVQNIDSLFSKIQLSSEQFSNLNSETDNQVLKDFGVYFENLTCIQYYIPIKEKESKQEVEKINSMIEETISKMKLKSIHKDTDIQEIAKQLTVLQKIKENIPRLEKLAGSTIKDILTNVQVQAKQYGSSSDEDKFVILRQSLKLTTEGVNIVAQQSVFEGLERALQNEQIHNLNIQDFLKEMDIENQGNKINNDEMQRFFDSFQQVYYNLINDHLVFPSPTIETIRHRTLNISRIFQGKVMTPQQKNSVPILLSHIFALWTLMNSENYFQIGVRNQEEARKYLLRPHAAQIVSIFRIFGLGYSNINVPSSKYHPIKAEQIEKNLGKKPELFDNLVQIKSGEGKSITLAVVAIIFALWGYDVSCACYSEYLSKRDHADFQKLFQYLGVQEQIYYGTFNQICERYINKDGQIRDLVLSRVLQDKQIKKGSLQVEKPRILLIDEVDCFFSKDFYSQAYCPKAVIRDQKISELIDYVWSCRESMPTVQSVQQNPVYAKCQQLFSDDYKELLDEAIKDIVYDLSECKNHGYIVKNGQIGYKDQDQISFKQKFGYKTVFAYYFEHEKGYISDKTLEENKYLGINCGEFSYAEIPLYFTLTMGVTGHLKFLCDSEKNIIQNVFKIVNFTYCPSVYGKSKQMWESNLDRITIEGQIQYFWTIINQINMIKGPSGSKRALIVFFKNEKRLKEYLQSPQLDAYKNTFQILTENVDESEKERIVGQACYPGMVTLSTPSFSRGIDFICRDKQVEIYGGVHVLYTYLSESKSEFLQLRGRISCKGNQGSYSMVLLDYDLLEFNIDRVKIDAVHGDYHKLLKEHRNKKLEIRLKVETRALHNIKKMHERSLNIKSLVMNGNHESDKEISKLLLEINKGPLIQNAVKTLIMINATSSMGSMLIKAKNSINIMFERASVILKNHDLDTNLILIQIGCYRNYSSGKHQILEYSPWETKRQNLNLFMKNIGPSGGQGNEAIEIALQHANNQADNCGEVPLHQVFLIGDAAPNTEQEVIDRRKQHGEQYWLATKFGPPTTSEEQFLLLSKKNIDLFSFYVVPEAKSSFDKLICGGGVSSMLDVNNEEIGQITLTNRFVNQILYKVGEINGGADLGKKLIEEYKRLYVE